jgi:hypothetical protein
VKAEMASNSLATREPASGGGDSMPGAKYFFNFIFITFIINFVLFIHIFYHIVFINNLNYFIK